jgi:hypothetical protein
MPVQVLESGQAEGFGRGGKSVKYQLEKDPSTSPETASAGPLNQV